MEDRQTKSRGGLLSTGQKYIYTSHLHSCQIDKHADWIRIAWLFSLFVVINSHPYILVGSKTYQVKLKFPSPKSKYMYNMYFSTISLRTFKRRFFSFQNPRKSYERVPLPFHQLIIKTDWGVCTLNIRVHITDMQNQKRQLHRFVQCTYNLCTSWAFT